MLSSLIGMQVVQQSNTKDGFHPWVGNVAEKLSEVLELSVFVRVAPL